MNEKSNISKNSTPRTIKDIAYTVDKLHGYKVHIKENGEYVPYLVLTDDYNGNCLLLREYLLDDLDAFKKTNFDSSKVSSYYETSDIDVFLNTEFINTLPSFVKEKIVDSTIFITTEDSIGICGTKTKEINRQVFLLSYAEVGGSKGSVPAYEGKTLKYFNDKKVPHAKEVKIAKTLSGEVYPWWLRTPDTWHNNMVGAVTVDGVIGFGSVGVPEAVELRGVRPAFCINCNVEIVKNDDIFILCGT